MTVTFDLSHGTESEQVEAFIEVTIEAWQLRSPTIIVNDDIPTMCITYQWLLPAWTVNTLRKYVIGESEHQMRLT